MNKMFDHILVPFNGCPGSQKAFKKAVALTKKKKSRMTVLTCLEEKSAFGLFKTKTNKQKFEKECKLSTKEHTKLEEYSQKFNVSFDSKIIKGDMASHSILELF